MEYAIDWIKVQITDMGRARTVAKLSQHYDYNKMKLDSDATWHASLASTITEFIK